MAHRPAIVLVAAALAATVSACGSSHQLSPIPKPSDPRTVEVMHMLFTPSTLTVHAGDTVTWKFDDRFPHSVQGAGEYANMIDSPIIDHGSWSYTFTKPGTYRYTCPLHPQMNGTIIVTG